MRAMAIPAIVGSTTHDRLPCAQRRVTLWKALRRGRSSSHSSRSHRRPVALSRAPCHHSRAGPCGAQTCATWAASRRSRLADSRSWHARSVVARLGACTRRCTSPTRPAAQCGTLWERWRKTAHQYIAPARRTKRVRHGPRLVIRRGDVVVRRLDRLEQFGALCELKELLLEPDEIR